MNERLSRVRPACLPEAEIIRLLFKEKPIQMVSDQSPELHSVIDFRHVVLDAVAKWRDINQHLRDPNGPLLPELEVGEPYWAILSGSECGPIHLRFGPRPDVDPYEAVFMLSSVRRPHSLRRLSRHIMLSYSPTKVHPEVSATGYLTPSDKGSQEMSVSLPAGPELIQFALLNIHDGLQASLADARTTDRSDYPSSNYGFSEEPA